MALGILDRIFGNTTVTAPAFVPPAPAATPLPAAATASDPATSDTEFSLTDSASNVLKTALSKQTVLRHGRKGMESAPFPIAAVTLRDVNGIADIIDRSANGMAVAVGMNSDDLPKSHHVSLGLQLSRPMTDYDLPSLNKALRAVVSSIPAFAGKIEALPVQAERSTYATVWQELAPLLSAHSAAFTPKEINMIGEYFEAHKGKDAMMQDWMGGVSASHKEGKVSIRMGAQNLPKDKNATLSTDGVLVDYFKNHHDQLLTKVKEKALALGVLKPEELAHLDMHVEATEWDIEAHFGTKPASDIDPATGKKLTDVELSKKMTETPLAKIDTEKLASIFTQAMLESSKELPPILPRIMSASMLADVLKQRVGTDPAIEKLMGCYDMFATEEQLKETQEKRVKSDHIILSEAYPNRNAQTGQSELYFSFNLPAGMDVTKFMTHLVDNRAQLALAVQPRTGAALGTAA